MSLDTTLSYEEIERKRDRNIALASSASVFLILGLFLYFIKQGIQMPPTKSQAEYENTELAQEELTKEEFVELEALTAGIPGGGGSGMESKGQKADQYIEQTEQILSSNEQSSVKVPTGNSNVTNTNNISQNQSSGIKNPKPNSPFSNNPGGKGDGIKGGVGKIDGSGTGNKPGPLTDGKGTAGNLKRKLLVSLPNISADEDAVVVLKIVVDEFGMIVGAPKNIYSETTTENTDIINKVINLVKTKASFTPSPGAKDWTTKIKITVQSR